MISTEQINARVKLGQTLTQIFDQEKNAQLNKIITKLQQDSDRFEDLGQGDYVQGYREAVRTAIGIISESLTG